MASRTQHFVVKPWAGGLNTSLDPALLNPEDLTIGDNLVFSPSGPRKTRGGIVPFDYVGTGVSRSSSGMTRTVVVTLNSGFTLSNGDSVSIYRPDSSLNTDYDQSKVTISSVDTVTYSPDVAFSYTATTSLTESSTADDNFVVGIYNTEKVLCIADYWYWNGTTRVHKRVMVTSAGTFYELASSGSKTALTVDGTVSLTAPISKATWEVLDSKLVFAFSGLNNKPVYWAGSGNILPIKNKDFAGTDVTSTNPVPDIENIRVHQGRLWGIDKTTDRIHYSDIGEPQRWNGEGDSGAIDLPKGNGDPGGLSAIYPPFKGQLPVAKNRQLFRIIGEAPLFAVETISEGIGGISHDSAIAMDQDDVLLASVKGIHSFNASDAFGDFSGTFISAPIQQDYNEIETSDKKFIKGAYLSFINSAAFAVRESGNTSNNAIYLVNLSKTNEGSIFKWCRWEVDHTSARFESLGLLREDDQDVLVMGTHEGRVLKYSEDATTDMVGETIPYHLKTGIIYPDNNPHTIKGFKSIGVLYKTARQAVTFDLKFKVDNFQTQTTTISQDSSSDLVGTSFILGSSTLGVREILLPVNISVDGYGYGCSIEIEASTPIEIYGYTIEFEPAGDQQAVTR